MSIIYNPKDIFIAQQNETTSSFVEVVLRSSPNSFVYFDSGSNITTSTVIYTASYSDTSLHSATSDYSSLSLTASYALNGGTGGIFSVSSSWASSSLVSSNLASIYNFSCSLTAAPGSTYLGSIVFPNNGSGSVNFILGISERNMGQFVSGACHVATYHVNVNKNNLSGSVSLSSLTYNWIPKTFSSSINLLNTWMNVMPTQLSNYNAGRSPQLETYFDTGSNILNLRLSHYSTFVSFVPTYDIQLINLNPTSTYFSQSIYTAGAPGQVKIILPGSLIMAVNNQLVVSGDVITSGSIYAPYSYTTSSFANSSSYSNTSSFSLNSNSSSYSNTSSLSLNSISSSYSNNSSTSSLSLNSNSSSYSIFSKVASEVQLFNNTTQKWYILTVSGSEGQETLRATVEDDFYQLQSIITSATITPSGNDLTLVGSQNAVRIFTEDTSDDEPYFYLYIKRSFDLNTLKIKMYRWQGRILVCPKNSTLSFGTTDGRTIKVSPLSVNISSLDTVSGVNGNANCDKSGPPLWIPTAAHITLPSKSNSFTINSNGLRQIIFISEYDDITESWTPYRFVIVPLNQNITVKCNYTNVALANYNGNTASITAPVGSMIGGTSQIQHLSFPEVIGTTWNVSDWTTLQAAITGAISGDEIVLQDGMYFINKNITQNDFNANVSGGNAGMEGITIRGQSGNRDNVIITGSYNWSISNSGSTLYSGFKDLTFDFNNNTLAGMQLSGGYWVCENVRWTRGSSQPYSQPVGDVPIYADFLNCSSDNAVGDCWGAWGASGTSDAAMSSSVRLINCIGYESGPGAADQVITTHGYQPLYVYGGNYSGCNTSSNLIANGNNTETVFCYFTNLSNALGNRYSSNLGTGNLKNVSLFGCYWSSSIGGTITLNSDSYILFNELVNKTSNITFPIATNIISNNIHSSSYPMIYVSNNGIVVNNNLIFGPATGAIYVSSNATSTSSYSQIYNNTFISTSAVLVNNYFENYNISFIDNICAVISGSSIFSFSDPSFASRTSLNSGYNIFPNKNTSSYISTTDITSSAPNISSYYIPIQGGNADQNGSGSVYDYIGDSDYVGRVFIQKQGVASKGAISRQYVDNSILIYPDVI